MVAVNTISMLQGLSEANISPAIGDLDKLEHTVVKSFK